jgi:hypothetical protein
MRFVPSLWIKARHLRHFGKAKFAGLCGAVLVFAGV